MLDLRVDLNAGAAPSRQLIDAVLDAVAGGALRPGDRLPSVRGAAAAALVNPNTVGKAWRELELLGVVEGRNGSGVYVTTSGPAIAGRLRRTATLDLFRRAATSALMAGHAPEDLCAWIEQSAPAPAPGRNP